MEAHLNAPENKQEDEPLGTAQAPDGSRWLVTGGAGYIGAHVVRALQAMGVTPVVLDDLSTGLISRIPPGVPYVLAKVSDSGTVKSVIANEGLVGIIHLAGSKQARESIQDPIKYWRNNTAEMTELLGALEGTTIQRFVFSSSSSIYGSQPGVTEDSAPQPNSPYAHTKLSCELLLKDYARVSAIQFVSLRYFNVIGCIPEAGLADTGPDNLIPRFLTAISNNMPLPVYGRNYATQDGTCLRDYVDVRDLARAHALAVRALDRNSRLPPVINLSTGIPTSVLEVAHLVNQEFGRDIDDIDELQPKPGDPAEVWGRATAAKNFLEWSPYIEVKDSIRDHITSLKTEEDSTLGVD